MEHNSRRRFIGNSALALGSVGLLSAQIGCKPNQSGIEKMFVHHVFFWLKEPENSEIRERFENELQELATIETIRYKHIGRPAATRREVIDSSYTFSLLVIFDDKVGQDIYQEHQIHLTFIENCKDLWEKVLVYDIA
jgi:hypothetical protein